MSKVTTVPQATRVLPRWREDCPGAAIVLVYLALAALLAMPMLLTAVPLGVDNLDHLARVHVQAHIEADPDLARSFYVKASMVPYLGMDLLLTPFARMLPTLLVGRLFILTLALGLVGAVAVLQRVFTSRVGLGPATAGLIAYNGLMAWGLLNYVLGLILALLAFAAWHSLRERPWLTRMVLFSGVATALYLTHLLAFALYGILILSYEALSRPRVWLTPFQDWCVLAGQAIPVLLLWSTLTGSAPSFDYAPHYVPLAKPLALESPFLFRGAVGGFDTGTMIFLACGIVLLLGARRSWFVWSRLLVGPSLVLLALGIVLPFRVFGVALIDHRFAVPAVCLAFAGVRLPRGSRPFAVPVVVVVVALLTVVRIADVSLLMRRCDDQYAELRHALAGLPRGAELTTVEERTDPLPGAACTALPIYEHIAQLVTIDRSGYAPDFFAHVTPVSVRGGRPTDTDPASAETFDAAPTSGYVLWIHLGHRRPAPPGLVAIHRGSFFDIWQPQLTPALSPPAPPLPTARAASPSG